MMPNLKYCPECGAPTSGAKFCSECGARTESSAAAPVATPTLAPCQPAPAVPLLAATPTSQASPTDSPDTEVETEMAAEEEEMEEEAEAGNAEEGEADQPAEAETGAANLNEAAPAAAAKKAVKVSTRISYDAGAEPYEKGKCSVTLALTVRPDDGHPDGPQVVIGIRSHDEPPLLKIRRLKELGLPEELLVLLQQYEGELPRRGAAKAAAKAREEAGAKAAAENRKQAEAARKARTASKATSKTATNKAAAKPAAPDKPQPEPVKLATLF